MTAAAVRGGGIVATVAMVACLLAWIWTGDGRWGWTALVVFIPAFLIMGVVAGQAQRRDARR